MSSSEPNPLTRVSAQEPRPKHVLVFQHIPLYLKSPDEEDDYFNLRKAARQNLLARFKKAGRTAGLLSPLFYSICCSFDAVPLAVNPCATYSNYSVLSIQICAYQFPFHIF